LKHLSLNENNPLTSEAVKAIAEALAKTKCGLEDIDLQKCGISTESVKPLATFLQKKGKIRMINLSNNNITDEGGRLLLAAVQVNPYLLKFKLDLNPTRTQYSKDIEQICS
jgi:Ran GTPase-activating protein (RanGAP) involved in mRNA processing and transport